jgi:hypothetical protein
MRVQNSVIFMVVSEKEDAKIFHLANLLAKHRTRPVEWTHMCP